jgi:uncharacterized protein YfaS (alpha-2-macroglobulin family)
MRAARPALAALCLCAAVVVVAGARSEITTVAARVASGANPGPWAEIDRLIRDQKLAAAAQRIEAVRAAAARRGDEGEWARALVRAAQVRIALGGFETAVAELRAARWPRGALAHAELDLTFAHALHRYLETYSWEINRRERVETKGPLDLKHWTREQIAAAADGAFADAWRRRGELGAQPVRAFAGVVVPSTYPRAVRGTLRDAISYLYVDFLADSSWWTPDQSDDAARLDLSRLLAADSSSTGSAPATATAEHPLLRLVAALADLERWHSGAGRGAAALETRLERARRLHAAFSGVPERRQIRAALDRWLTAARGLSWWSEGQAVAASLRMEETDAGALREARELALAGEGAYPASVGARDCRALIAQIEAPAFELQAMASDGLARRSIEVDAKNVPQLFFRAYAIDLPGRMHRGATQAFPQASELPAGAAPAAQWSVELPATPDFRQHRTYVTPPIGAPGGYLLLASANRSFATSHNRIVEVPLILGDLVLASETIADGVRLRLLTGEGGQPVAGAAIEIFTHDWRSGFRGDTHLVTDSGGAASLQVSLEEQRFALARRGSDLALLQLGQYWRLPASGPAALFFTDRSIYRPGQTVRWKVLAYGGDRDSGHLALEKQLGLTVRLLDPNSQESAIATVTTNDFGTAAGAFVVPAGRPLGRWELAAMNEGESATAARLGSVGLQVEEYKRPTFEVTIGEPPAALRLNQPAVLRGEARYYFGLPVTAGRVRWRVTREPVLPWWWWWEWGGVPNPQAEQKQVASGSAKLADGAFEAHFVPAADERLDHDVSYSYRLHAEVTDDGGETRSADRSFRLGFVALEATVESALAFLDAGSPAEMEVQRRDLNGVPRAGAGRWKLLALKLPASAPLPADLPVLPQPGTAAAEVRTPGDAQNPRWQRSPGATAVLRSFEDGPEIGRGAVTHDAAGKATIKLPPLGPGAYRLRYETVDDFGATASAQREFVVAGEARVPVATLLAAQRGTANVGETVRLLVHSGLSGQPLELSIHRAGAVERRRLSANPAPQVIELPVRPEDRGGLGFELVALHDHQLLTEQTFVQVPWDDHQLAIEYQTFRDRLRPGGKETWRLKVTAHGPSGPEPVVAELLTYMYDRSLDAYAPHQPPRPLDLFPHPQLAARASSLGSRYASFVRGTHYDDLPQGAGLEPDRPVDIENVGIGGPGFQNLDGVAGGVGVPKPEAVAAPAAVAEAVTVTAEAPMLDSAGRLGALGYAGGAPAAPPPPAPEVVPRTNFSETAFWQPHLVTAADGTAAIELTVPDSVTSWSVWVHGLTRDFRSGEDHREARSVKDLMVRPYLPRFLREGDRATLRVVLDDASPRAFDGFVTLDIQDPEHDASLLAEFGLTAEQARLPFHVEAGKSSSVAFALDTPRRVGEVAFKVVATAGDTSDGELRPLPVLPSRLHLAQSRFVALKDRETRTMTFGDLERSDDRTLRNERLVVTLDAQLFYSVLAAVPYLVDYPYECTEQTLNRFLSTAILSSLFTQYPTVALMAQDLARRETRTEPFGGADPNRQMALEETPWLLESQGRTSDVDRPLVKVLDPRIARAQRDASLAKLEREQLPSGAFSWWAGGPPSDYMTLYLLYGFAKAREFGVEVPREMVTRGWRYLGERYRQEFRHQLAKPDCKCAWEFLTFLNYIASAYADPGWLGEALPVVERRRILDASFRHWHQHPPYLKALLALTLKRMGRPDDARLVFDSVMDSAQTTPDEGTFWRPDDRSWLWYHDAIESHATALRTLSELRPQDPRLAGLVQWLFLNKKLNHWKSTRATAEVVYSLAKYLASHHELAARESATVEVAGQRSVFTFEPDRYTGKKVQLVVAPPQLGPAAATVTVAKQTPGLLFASATWHFSTDQLPATGRGDLFAVERRYFRRQLEGSQWVLVPLAEGATLAVGDEVEIQLSLRSRAEAEYVHLRDPRAAGFEPGVVTSGWRWDLGPVHFEEVRDSGTNFFFEWLPAGEMTLRYRVRAALAGTFRVGPATLQSMYAPEFTAYSAGQLVTIHGGPAAGRSWR